MADKKDKDRLQVPDGVQLQPPHEPETELQPAPAPSKPAALPVQPAPPVTPSSVARPQPSQDVSPSAAPADPRVTFVPQQTRPAAPQPSQDPGRPNDVWQPKDVEVSPSRPPAGPVDIGFSPAPNATLPEPPVPVLSRPADLPPPPVPVTGTPATLPSPPAFDPNPNATLPPPPEVDVVFTRPAPPEPVTFVPRPPATLPPPPDFKPDPNSVLPNMPAPPPSVPAALPAPPDFKPAPNAVLPFEPAPPPSVPAVLPPPPPFAPNPNAVLPGPPPFAPNPNAVLPGPPPFNPDPNSVLPPPPPFAPNPNAPLPAPPPFAPNPNATLPGPPPFVPNPNATLPGPPAFAQPPVFAPNGTLEPSKDRLGRLDLVDQAVKESLRLLVPFSETGGGAPGSRAGDPVQFAKNLANLGRQLGPFGLNQFSALQYVLFAMNVNGKVWNPATLIAPPGTSPFVPAAVDDIITHEDLVRANELTQLLQVNIGNGLRANANLYTEDNPYTVDNGGNFFSVGGLVDTVVGSGDEGTANDDQILVTDPVTKDSRVDITRLYAPSSITLGFNPIKNQAPGGSRNSQPQALAGAGPKLAKAYYASGIVPAGFDNETNGFLRTVIRQKDPSTLVDDDSAYVPLSFMDLRPMNGSNEVRTVYFRPFITNLTEELSPEWNKQNYFGRTDPVATYMATGRSINIGFSVQAFAPEDLELIYQKKNWLASMCYPSYDKDVLFKSGPVIRLRVGDLLKTTGGYGLPGIIESLSFDYTDSVWELQKGNKVPMGFKVSMGFLVLHEKPIGLGVDGQFGGIGRIDASTGRWSPPQNTTNSDSQNAPEMDADAVNSFAGGTGNNLNAYARK